MPDLTQDQQAVLDIIRERGPVTVADLAATLNLSRVVVGLAAGVLVRAHLVDRVSIQGEKGRHTAYRVVPDGKRLHELATIAGLYAVDPEPF